MHIVRRGPGLGVDVTGCALEALERVAEQHLGPSGTVLPPWGTLHAFAPWRADPAMTPATPVAVGGVIIRKATLEK